MLTGVTTTTKTNLQLGAGVVCTSYTPGAGGTITGIIGATRGGGSFSAVPTMRQIPADGIPDNVVGFQYIDFWVASLKTTVIEASDANIKIALAGGSSSTSANVTTITATQGLVADASHADLWWVGDTADGKKIAIKLVKALNTSGFNVTFSDRGEGTFDLEAVANYDVSTLSTPPFTIYLDKSTAA